MIEVEGGRDLAWSEFGAADGVPVLVFHGSPGTRYFLAAHGDAAARKGVRMIAPDRPGYGHSTHHPERTFETWARDVERLADHLSLDRFHVLGVSSGGPNAAVCACLLADRVARCAIVSSPAPPEAGIGNDRQSNTSRIFDFLSMKAPALMAPVYKFGLQRAQQSPKDAVAVAARWLSPADATVLQRPDISAALRDELSRPVASTAGRAAVQDLRLEQQSWGFSLSDIATGVDVWHGELDYSVPVASGVHLADEIPDAVLHRLPDDGHLLVHTHFDAIIDQLVR